MHNFISKIGTIKAGHAWNEQQTSHTTQSRLMFSYTYRVVSYRIMARLCKIHAECIQLVSLQRAICAFRMKFDRKKIGIHSLKQIKGHHSSHSFSAPRWLPLF